MILLLSGGIDSFCAFHYLKQPKTVYFNLRCQNSEKELHYIHNNFPKTIVDNSLNLSNREMGEKAYVPFRNLLIAAQAVKYDDHIVIAGLKDDQVSDKNETIFQEMSNILSKMEGRKIKIFSPFWEYTKVDLVRWWLTDFGGSVDSLLKTVSCYDNTINYYCGKCPCCFRKWIALKANGIHRLEFFNSDLINEYYIAAKMDKYIPERNKTIIEVIDEYRN